jgi:hypothetical protein
MKDLIFKMKILLMMFQSTFKEWKIEVYQKDLDSPYCCSGYECGCCGMTVRDLYSPENQICE